MRHRNKICLNRWTTRFGWYLKCIPFPLSFDAHKHCKQNIYYEVWKTYLKCVTKLNISNKIVFITWVSRKMILIYTLYLYLLKTV